MLRKVLCYVIIGCTMLGCQSEPQKTDATPASITTTHLEPVAGAASGQQSSNPSAGTPQDRRVLAILDGTAVADTDLQAALLEAAGGEVLAEVVLDHAVAAALARKGLRLTGEHVQEERKLILATLDPTADRAEGLLDALKRRRGWGEVRFRQMLQRNAGLRLLVQDRVNVTDTAVRTAFEIEYGPQFEVRLITVASLAAASDIRRRAATGEQFSDLAVSLSTDESKTRGGLLSPMSPADPSYPQAIRAALGRLAVGDVSDPIAIESGFAIIKLTRKIDARAIQFDDVRKVLAEAVRRKEERELMQGAARQLLVGTDVTVLDPALAKSWEEQKRLMLKE